MMNVPSALGWFGFRKSTSGDGILTIDGEVATISSGAGSGTARLSKTLKLAPGERMDLSVFARRISGPADNQGEISINFPSIGVMTSRVEVASTEWQEYTISYAAPFNVGANQYASISIGVFTPNTGEIQAAYPRISVSNTSFGAPRVHSIGMVGRVSGEWSLVKNYMDFGIKGFAYDASTQVLSLQLEPGITTENYAAGPIFLAQLTPNAYPEMGIRVGLFDRATGILSVKFVDTTTGQFIDIASLSNNFYFYLVGFF